MPCLLRNYEALEGEGERRRQDLNHSVRIHSPASIPDFTRLAGSSMEMAVQKLKEDHAAQWASSTNAVNACIRNTRNHIEELREDIMHPDTIDTTEKERRLETKKEDLRNQEERLASLDAEPKEDETKMLQRARQELIEHESRGHAGGKKAWRRAAKAREQDQEAGQTEDERIGSKQKVEKDAFTRRFNPGAMWPPPIKRMKPRRHPSRAVHVSTVASKGSWGKDEWKKPAVELNAFVVSCVNQLVAETHALLLCEVTAVLDQKWTYCLSSISKTGRIGSPARAKMASFAITEDFYKILEVDQAASPATIIAAYKRLALKLHPDHNRKPDATAAFQRSDSASHSGVASETAQILALQQSKHDRAAQWRICSDAFNTSIRQISDDMRQLQKAIQSLDSISAAEAAEEARKYSWGTWLLSPFYKKAEDSEEVKAQKDRARQERRIERDMKERRFDDQATAKCNPDAGDAAATRARTRRTREKG
ncbi:hypothetical protein OPT61_g7413 [Boeremia exigua]|uniref:Uncharacterized protein n=1 Tax=Boeremia exigua TaxID=749465 RepID=A0ACC2I2V4_9PLEO|nr:hypothetical protein OPT61_g7413 [Boeremia exigua]